MSNLFLNIDYNMQGATDHGSRPYTGPNVLWNNVSLFLDGGPSQTETNVGTPTTGRVRVSNTSTTQALTDVSVDLYVMSPFIGLVNPANAVRRLHGFAASIGPGSGTPGGTDGHIVTCKIQDPNQGPIPWTPTQSDLDSTTDGHLCLVANAYGTGVDGSDDGAAVPDGGAFDVVNDPHQGQRNIHVLAAAKAKSFQFHVYPALDGGETAIDIHQLSSAVLANPSERWALRSKANIGIRRGAGSRVLWLGGRRGQEAVPLSFSRKAVRGTIELQRPDVRGTDVRREATLVTADLGDLGRFGKRAGRDSELLRRQRHGWSADRLVYAVPQEGVRASLSLDRTDQAGSVQAFDVVQRDATGRALGGMRILSVQR